MAKPAESVGYEFYCDADTQFLFESPEKWMDFEMCIQARMAADKLTTRSLAMRILALSRIIDDIHTRQGGTLRSHVIALHLNRLQQSSHPANVLRTVRQRG